MGNALKQFRKGWEIFEPFRKKMAVMLVYMVIIQFTWQAGPFILGKTINSMQTHRPLNGVLILAALIYLAHLIGLSLSWRRSIFQEHNIDYWVERHLTNLTLNKVLGLSIAQHRSQNSGITQSVVTKGRNSLEQMVYMVLYTILPLLLGVGITLVCLLWFCWPIGLFVLACTALYTWISFRDNRLYRPAVTIWNDVGDRNTKHFSEILRNMSLIQTNSQEVRVEREHDERQHAWIQKGQEAWLPYIMRSNFKYALVFTMRFLVTIAAILLVYKRGYKIGDAVIIWTWSNQATSDLWSIAPLQRQWLDHWSRVKKYFSILDVEPRVRVVQNPIRPGRFSGRVEFRDVSYTYSEQKYVTDDDELATSGKLPLPALHNVSLVIEPGQIVALVGESGAGKSTLATLLIRGDDPDRGQILIDDHDLRLLDLHLYRQALGVVDQNIPLFDHTIRYNILFGLNGRAQYVTEDELRRVAEISRINRFEHRLVDGWETMIGENGIRLSGGERQRVGIARALIKDPRFLILDEATSHLDPKNERAIKEAVAQASVGRTTIIIAHRLSTVRDVDQIFVMDKGSIVAKGRHEELCETSSHYRELVNDQLVHL